MFVNTDRSVTFKTVLTILLCLATVAAYWQITDNQFISYDDTLYISDNPRLRSGLTLNSIQWAFTSLYAANWHPLTWLSHMADVQLFGLNPAGHHLVNVVLHTASAVMLFLFLSRFTGFIERSAVVAMFFALHPLHVESVAWAAERKDVLSAFFWMLTLYLYCAYARQQRPTSFLLAIAAYILGLMAKPMLVTVPIVMFLLDYWPLKRFSTTLEKHKQTLWILLKEKVPFLILATVSCTVTIIAQQRGLAITSLAETPLLTRIANASVSCVHYLVKVIWPHDLAVFYPFPESMPAWQTSGATGLLIAFTFLVFRQRQRYPYLIIGWSWYLLTLLPVVGIVRVGLQAMADRYTYIPLTGIFILLVWGVSDLTANLKFRKQLLTGMTTITLTVCLLSTRNQVSYWHDTKTLFTHALEATDNNFIAHCMLGGVLEKEGKLDEALGQYDKAITIAPWYESARIHQGIILKNQGRLDAAVVTYSEVIAGNPGSSYGYLNLGIVMALQNKLEDARTNFETAVRLNPRSAVGHYNLGLTLNSMGKVDEAIEHFFTALENDPFDAECRNNLGVALVSKGRTNEAIQQFSEAIKIKPDFYDAISNRELALKIPMGTAAGKR